MDIFETCHTINDFLIKKEDVLARNELIKLLDYHAKNELPYSALVNHLIRETGLYPYIETGTASWQDRFVYEAFKVNTGGKEDLTLHREQSSLLKKLIDGKSIAVSAPTSFGKSFVIDAFISINKPKNVVILVPTIALTDETRRRLYKKFSSKYKIITTTHVELDENNIFIFPQERAINYVDKIANIDLLIVDEFYKASSIFDKERAPTLIKAILKLGQKAKQKYFLAPNISILNDNIFTEGMEFYSLDFNTVYLDRYNYYDEIKNNDVLKSKKLLDILSIKKTKTLIYAGTYANINSLSLLLTINIQEKDKKLLNGFSDWLTTNYSLNWSLTNLVKRGVGIHNGRLHRSLSQIQVKLFEEIDGLDNIISTSSIIEGVNTSAENVIIWSNKTGKAKLNDFTYKNIMGRSGRMFKHFIGKIYILEKPPKDEMTQLDIPFPEEILGDLDVKDFSNKLTKTQIEKIEFYREEMASILGKETFERMQAGNVFQISDTEVIKNIAYDMFFYPNEWNGLTYLNSLTSSVSSWDRMLYKILKLHPSGWDSRHRPFVEFIKILRKNWFKSIPELLEELGPHGIGIEEFFKLEKEVTFKLASLMSDINILQKEILKEKKYDISRFVSLVSRAFLPLVAFQLEEFGLPRMISKKLHESNVIDFYNKELTIHSVLKIFNDIGIDNILSIADFTDFDEYIFRYFYDGISSYENS